MNDEKMIVNDYEVMEKSVFGGIGFFIAEYKGEENKERYATGTIDRSYRDLGFERFTFSYATNNYMEVLKKYHECIIEKIDDFIKQTMEAPKEIYTSEQCNPLSSVDSINGRIVVQSISDLYPEYQNASQQIFLATGGFGCNKNSRGSAVYAINLFDGKETRLERHSLLGILKDDHIPDWASKQYEKIQAQKKRDKER